MNKKSFLMSSFLMFRICNPMDDHTVEENFQSRIPIANSHELEKYLKKSVENATQNGKAALALSGGIDSAILAKFMPKGSIAYTFKCIVPGIEVVDESVVAAKYAEECGLEHKVIEVYWEDFEKYSTTLMKAKGAPIHSIEVQIYKAALQAKADGVDTLIFGEAADAVYGGHSSILSEDRLVGDFIERYSYVMPYKALKDAEVILNPFLTYAKDGIVYPYEFMSQFYIEESVGSYLNATETAGVNWVLPYAETYLATKIDYARLRSGENKYLVREVFSRLYPDFTIPPKTPMPRPMNEWFRDWEGPTRPEFWPHCTDNMSGDQKWLVWVLEQYLNMIEG